MSNDLVNRNSAGLARVAAVASLVALLPVLGCRAASGPGDAGAPDADLRSAVEIAAASPFGVYSPIGEARRDKTSFMSEAELARALDDLGVKWVQELQVSTWQGIVSDPMNVYARVGREAGMNPGRSPDETYQAALRSRIRAESGRVKTYEVDTEPNGIGGWGANPAGYAQLLKVTRDVVHAECPDCSVLFGGLTGWDGPLEPKGAQFLDDVLAAGGTFDGIEIKFHHVGAQQYPDLQRKRESVCAVLARHGRDCAATPMFLETATHDGDPHHPEPTRDPMLVSQTEMEQACGLVKTYVHAIAIGMDRVFWDDLVERTDFEPGSTTTPFPQNPFNHYGLIHTPTNADGLSGKKLAYFSYKKMVALLEGSEWKKVEHSTQGGDVQVYRFPRAGRSVWVVWSDSASGGQATVSGLGSPRARLTAAVAHFDRGQDVAQFSGAFATQELEAPGGAVQVTLTDRPVFVEELSP